MNMIKKLMDNLKCSMEAPFPGEFQNFTMQHLNAFSKSDASLNVHCTLNGHNGMYIYEL